LKDLAGGLAAVGRNFEELHRMAFCCEISKVNIIANRTIDLHSRGETNRSGTDSPYKSSATLEAWHVGYTDLLKLVSGMHIKKSFG
jgi:hypothetical protein